MYLHGTAWTCNECERSSHAVHANNHVLTNAAVNEKEYHLQDKIKYGWDKPKTIKYGIIRQGRKLGIDLGKELARQYGKGSRVAPRIVPSPRAKGRTLSRK